MTQNKEDLVKLTIVFNPDAYPEGPRAECPWGEPIEANSGGGTFKILNNCSSIPLQVGDVVTAELAGDARMQVTGIQSLVPGVWSTFLIPEGADDPEVIRGGNQLIKRGAKSADGGLGQLTICWPPDKSVDQVTQLLAGSHVDRWEMILVTAGDCRLQSLNAWIQFELVEQDPREFEPIDYWAAEDPGWEKVGVREPAVLAYIQSLAASDPQVLATIEAGLHGNVLKYLMQISAFLAGDESGPDICWLIDAE